MSESTYLSIEELNPGQVIDGRYEIAEFVATGGMATVYRALDLQNDRQEVALKLLHKDLAQDKDYLERFIREVQLLHRIDHPNLVRSLDLSTNEGLVYFTMEFVHGKSLEQVMAEESFPPERICHLIIEICRGLSILHHYGIVHRDLKPANILISREGNIKLIDLGVARDKASRLTKPNQTIGSVCFIAPEIWFGRKPTHAADLYSLGILLYELVTGDVPFNDPLPGKMLELHLNGIVPPPRQTNSDCPRWLNDLILKLLQKHPKDRPNSAPAVISLVEMELAMINRRAPQTTEEKAAIGSAKFGPAEEVKEKVPVRSEFGTPQRKTVVMSLRATQVFEDVATQSKKRPRASVIIPLPRRAALVFEIEAPSRDVLAFGVFLGSLQVLDGALTHYGVQTWGISAEGNPALRTLMESFGPEKTLVVVKCLAVIAVAFLTYVAKRKKLFRNLIGALTCFYLFAAIFPWVYFLSRHYSE